MLKKINKVFIATSLDGFIADKEGKIDWLETFPEINTIDTGYKSFMASIDALVMGRTTFETVCSFDIPWPYTKPVYVLSNTLKTGDLKFDEHITYLKGQITDIIERIHQDGYHSLYIDGGRVIQDFLTADLIEEMIITVIPVLLGDGFSLFGKLDQPLKFKCIASKHYLNAVAQNHFVRIRE